jgi:hypothetical protein
MANQVAHWRFKSESVYFRRCVLVMPPLSQWAMIITEAVVRDCYSSLAYFVVGPCLDFRVVICHEDLIQRYDLIHSIFRIFMRCEYTFLLILER